ATPRPTGRSPRSSTSGATRATASATGWAEVPVRRSPLPVIVLLVAALGCAVAAYFAASGSVHGGRPVAADRTPLLSARRAPALLAASVGDPALRAAPHGLVGAP